MNMIVPSQSVKRPGSPLADAAERAAKERSQNPVHITEDVWLEAIKHLSCTKWSKMRLVSYQINGLVGRNVSRLPMAIVESSAMKLRNRKENEVKMIVSDSNISPDEQEQWFKDRGMTINVLAGIQLDNAIIEYEKNHLKENCCFDLWILGPAQKKKLTFDERARPWFLAQQFKAEVRFYAEFSPHRNKYSWASMAFFLKLLYDPSTFVKNLSMYAVNNKVKDTLFSDEEKRYIRCELFTLQLTANACVKDQCESVSWLEQNVRADMVQFPNDIQYNDSEICDAVTDYILSSSWISASQVVNLGYMDEHEHFFGNLIKKFPNVAVQSIFPAIVFSGWQPLCCNSLNNQLSGKWIVKEKLEVPEDESDESKNKETYTISNGSNRMGIEFNYDYSVLFDAADILITDAIYESWAHEPFP